MACGFAASLVLLSALASPAGGETLAEASPGVAPGDEARVTVVRAAGDGLPTARSGCEHLGAVEVRTALGDRTASSLSWAARPRLRVYRSALEKRAARLGGDTLVVLPPTTRAFGSEGVLRGAVFGCSADSR